MATADAGASTLLLRETVDSTIPPVLAESPDPSPTTPPRPSPRVSVVVPTRGRPRDLERCLRAILDSGFADFELIVVDQSPQRQALDLPDERVRHLQTDTIGKSSALNAGFALARAPLIMCTDDDCTPGPEWLSYALEAFERDSQLMLLYGELRAIPHNAALELIPETIYRESTLLTHPSQLLGRHVAGANFAFRRELLDAVRGFDEGMGPGTSIPAWEEYDFAYRALLAGHAVRLDKGTVVTHWGARSIDTHAARRLLENYEYSEGAVLGKHLRNGDSEILRYLVRRTGRPVKWVLAGAVRGSRRSGTRGLVVFSRGLLAGFLRPQAGQRLFAL